MTYNVFGRTLNPTLLVLQLLFHTNEVHSKNPFHTQGFSLYTFHAIRKNYTSPISVMLERAQIVEVGRMSVRLIRIDVTLVYTYNDILCVSINVFWCRWKLPIS